MKSDGGNRIFRGWFYRLVPTLSSAGEITATKTEMSVACEKELVSDLALKDSPSGFPPVNTLPSSCALRENGISSSVSKIIDIVSAIGVMLERRCETLRAREQSASESMPASVRRGSCDPFASGEASNVRRKRTTSSNISSSHRLSLSPSEARTRMSSAHTGSVITCAALGGVLEAGPSCSGVLNWEQSVDKNESGRGEGMTYGPPHLLTSPDDVSSPNQHAHAISEVCDSDNRIMGLRICDYTHFGCGNVRACTVQHS